jgi:hypothetical protein
MLSSQEHASHASDRAIALNDEVKTKSLDDEVATLRTHARALALNDEVSNTYTYTHIHTHTDTYIHTHIHIQTH